MKNYIIVIALLVFVATHAQNTLKIDEIIELGQIAEVGSLEGDDVYLTKLLQSSVPLQFSDYQYDFIDSKDKNSFIKIKDLHPDFLFVQNPFYTKLDKKKLVREEIIFKNDFEKKLIDYNDIKLTELDIIEKLFEEYVTKKPSILFKDKKKRIIPLKKEIKYTSDKKQQKEEYITYLIVPENEIYIAYSGVSLYEYIYSEDLDPKTKLINSFENFCSENYNVFFHHNNIIEKVTKVFEEKKIYGINWKNKALQNFTKNFLEKDDNISEQTFKSNNELIKDIDLKKYIADYYYENAEKISISAEKTQKLKEIGIIPYQDFEIIEMIESAKSFDDLQRVKEISILQYTNNRNHSKIEKYLDEKFLLSEKKPFQLLNRITEEIYLNEKNYTVNNYKFNTEDIDSGNGILKKDKQYIIGNFSDSNNKFICVSDKNEVYIGEIENDARHGEGVLYTNSTIEKGTWENNLKNGSFEISKRNSKEEPKVILYEMDVEVIPEVVVPKENKTISAEVLTVNNSDEYNKNRPDAIESGYRFIELINIENQINVQPSDKLILQITDNFDPYFLTSSYKYNVEIKDQKEELLAVIFDRKTDDNIEFENVEYPVNIKIKITNKINNVGVKSFEFQVLKNNKYILTLK